jgi:class 3 adenylate cyclase/putative methionine-R-sulfoxide reductase with GAF domain
VTPEELERENAALRERCAELEAKSGYLDVVNFFAASLWHTEVAVDDILWDVANSVVARLGLEDCVIYLLDDAGEWLVQRAAYGPKNPRGREILGPIKVRVGEGVVGAVAASGEAVVIRDTREDPRYICDDQPRLSELAVPIFFNERVLGVIDSEHSRADFFTVAHREILTTIASMTAARVGRALLDERLRRVHAELEQKVVERTRELTAANERSERLLLNTLPRPIAERLAQGEERIAERYEHVTVLFADIVGFTPLSASVAPEEVVDLLGRVFVEFDRITDRCGLEKIKTIGDAYMVVGGAPTPKADHREAMCEWALQALEAVERVNEEVAQVAPRTPPTRLDVRIGMHSGPVVGGVIGTRRIAYDLWGDTVNTASRMESHGVAGKIHVAEPMRRALEDRFEFAVRGKVAIKGLGLMRTYFLIGRKPPAG